METHFVQISNPNTDKVFLKGVLQASNLTITGYEHRNEFDINLNNPKTQDELSKKGISRIRCVILDKNPEQLKNILNRIGFENVKIRESGSGGGGGVPENFKFSERVRTPLYTIRSNPIELISIN